MPNFCLMSIFCLIIFQMPNVFFYKCRMPNFCRICFFKCRMVFHMPNVCRMFFSNAKYCNHLLKISFYWIIPHTGKYNRQSSWYRYDTNKVKGIHPAVPSKHIQILWRQNDGTNQAIQIHHCQRNQSFVYYNIFLSTILSKQVGQNS